MEGIDLESEMKELWSEYHTARADDFRSYDFAAVTARVRALRAKAKKLGLTTVRMQLGDFADNLARAREARLTPEERLAAYWPGLVVTTIENALNTADEVLRGGDRSKLRKAERLLHFCEQTERLADIAEDGLAAEFAALIPGAFEEDGMLFLSKGHEALLERARTMLHRVQAEMTPGT